MAKNPAAKTRKLTKGEKPYEVWADPSGTWIFRVVKKNQAPDKEQTNPYAIWNVAAITPHETDNVGHDTYRADVIGTMRLVWRDPDYARALLDFGIDTKVPTDPDGWKRYER